MGTPEFSIPALKILKESKHKIVCVYTQPPKKKSRGQKILKTAVHTFSEKEGIAVRTNKLSDKKIYEEFVKLKADIVIVVAYGQIIPKEFLNLTKKGFINIHASILPRWRGAAPIQRAIINLDKETGLSIMKIAEELDSGPICNTYKINIEGNLNAVEVSERLSSLAAEKILENIDDILDGKSNFIEQDHSKATYASKIEKSEGKINWNDDAKNIIGKINGLYPSPGAFFLYNGERYKILKADIGNGIGNPGEVISNYLEIVCGKNQSIKITEIQRQGKKPQNIGEFMLGSQLKKGSKI